MPEGKTGTLKAIENLGYVQIDTINVIERSHHIVFFTRCPDYKQQYLHELQVKDKKIFEYWAHAASFIPMKDYRFYIPAMKKKPKKDSWLDKWIKEHRSLIRKVKARVKKDGPLAASDFQDVKHRKRGPWWDWKPAKMALEALFWQGDLMIKERRKFQRIYDITERVLPENVDITKPSEEQEKKFFIRKALNAMGIATIQDINKYIGISGRLNKWVDQMLKLGQILELTIKGLNKSYYILTKGLEEIRKSKTVISLRVSFLSPFDNSIILRDRTSALFNFDYSLEAYVPKTKRKYGYFCLPILWQNQLIGKIDPKADRKNKILIINNLHLEDKKINYNKFIPALSRTLKDFADFHNCEKIELSKNIPAKISHKIKI
ncbi:YcaQ family DNA glycosylase [candidate division WOR-3 bacterium]|nr:YcaQ family DNA glycosylase [candidate division WOR-3 bacterium]